jgi:TPR repeat protein
MRRSVELLVGIAVAVLATICQALEPPHAIDGLVRQVTGTQVRIEAEREAKVGDPVKMYFVVAGFDELGLAGSGTVTAVSGKLVTAEISQRSGDLAVGQIAKIGEASSGPPPAPNAAAKSPAAKQASGHWLGLSLLEVGAAHLARDGIRIEQAAATIVTVVYPESPAALAGVRTMDVVVKANGAAVTSGQGLVDLVRGAEPGRPVRLEIVRGAGDRLTVELTPVAEPSERALLEIVRAAAERGDPAFELLLGLDHLYGTGGVRKDEREAVRWLSRAADHGHQDAQVVAAEMALFPQPGSNVRAPHAVRWLQQAAERGQPRAQYLLAELYRTGRIGGAANYPEALAWYDRSAANGVSVAMTTIGAFYENGWGVPKNVEQAIAWYRKAAALGEPAAQANLQRLGR